ncbi:hypothetical protein OKW50_003722 [Paraburkholderia youngii]
MLRVGGVLPRFLSVGIRGIASTTSPGARYHYSIRKQQNEFPSDLCSIKTG